MKIGLIDLNSQYRQYKKEIDIEISNTLDRFIIPQ